MTTRPLGLEEAVVKYSKISSWNLSYHLSEASMFFVLKKWQIKRQLKEALDESTEIRNIAMQLKSILSRPLGVCKSGRDEIAACAFCMVRCSLNNTREGASVQSLLKPQRKASDSQVAGYVLVFKA